MKDKANTYISIFGIYPTDNTHSFICEWWDENFHLGPQWRGQAFRTNLEIFCKRQKRPVIIIKNGNLL